MMMKKLARLIAIGFAFGLFAGTAPANAQNKEQELVDKARAAVEKLRKDPDIGSLNQTLAQAKGVLVIPSLIRAGLIIGGEGGSGVLLSRDAKGEWSYPAFYTMGSGSIGLQIGAEEAEVILVIVTDNGLDQVVKNEFKLGADASLAVGPKGMGVGAATTLNLRADIYSYAKTRGGYAGISLEGSVIRGREEWNKAYYGKAVTAREVLIERKHANPAADGLRTALTAR
jgi:lipid-binding SYLF domain-containing protein